MRLSQCFQLALRLYECTILGATAGFLLSMPHFMNLVALRLAGMVGIFFISQISPCPRLWEQWVSKTMAYLTPSKHDLFLRNQIGVAGVRTAGKRNIVLP